jgi:N-acetylglutamate synthase-like GNAT family acetyltransferase
MNIIIREAELADAATIVRLIDELAATGGEHSPLTEAYVATCRSSATSKILLAERQQCVVGLLSYSLRPDLYHAALSCLIEELIVQEAVRGQGVGSALMAELLARLATIDCAEVSVATMPPTPGDRSTRHGLAEEALFEKYRACQESTTRFCRQNGLQWFCQ